MKNHYKLAALLVLALGVLAAAMVCYMKSINRTGQQAISVIMKRRSSNQAQAEQIQTVEYKQDGISASYPQLAQGENEEDTKKINQMIQEDFNKILKIYSFHPFPEPTPVEEGSNPELLKIGYTIKLNNDKYISILYTAIFESPYSAHPTELVYTTNISKKDKKRLMLSDILNLNESLINNFRKWEFIPIEESNQEFNKAIRDYVTSISEGDLLQGFETADIIGSGNIWGVFSYLTENKLGISLGVPHYIGDHVEFEKEYSKLKDFLQSEKGKLGL